MSTRPPRRAIRYTTDGSTPTASSALYASAVSIASLRDREGDRGGEVRHDGIRRSLRLPGHDMKTVNDSVTGKMGQNQFELVGSWGSGASTGANTWMTSTIPAIPTIIIKWISRGRRSRSMRRNTRPLESVYDLFRRRSRDDSGSLQC